MGYIDSTTTVVEAILTKKGREILSKGGNFNITKFALADDEIDYRLWNEDHPNGSSHYGEAIENLPVLEASPDETQVMRYKLITLPKSTTRIPLVTLGFTSIQLNGPGDMVTIAPQTRFTLEDSLGYTVTLHNASYAFLEVVSGGGAPVAEQPVSQVAQTAATVQSTSLPTQSTFISADLRNQSLTLSGRSFRIVAKDVTPFTNSSVTTQVTVIGNQTGATVSVPVTIFKRDVSTPIAQPITAV